MRLQKTIYKGLVLKQNLDIKKKIKITTKHFSGINLNPELKLCNYCIHEEELKKRCLPLGSLDWVYTPGIQGYRLVVSDILTVLSSILVYNGP